MKHHEVSECHHRIHRGILRDQVWPQGTPGVGDLFQSDTIGTVLPQKRQLKLPATRGPHLQGNGKCSMFTMFCVVLPAKSHVSLLQLVATSATVCLE